MRVTLHLASENPRAVGEVAATYPPWSLHGRETLGELLRAGAAWRPWLVRLDGDPVGVFILRREPGGELMTTTYVAPKARRNGVNRQLKLATLAAARAHASELRFLVRDTNTSSLTSLRRIFPAITATRVDDTFLLLDPAAEATPTPGPENTQPYRVIFQRLAGET